MGRSFHQCIHPTSGNLNPIALLQIAIVASAIEERYQHGSDDYWPLARLIERDGSAVIGNDFSHTFSSLFK